MGMKGDLRFFHSSLLLDQRRIARVVHVGGDIRFDVGGHTLQAAEAVVDCHLAN